LSKMSKVVIVAIAVVVALMATATEAYKPIVGIHGFTGTYTEFNKMKAELEKYQPGHPFFPLDVDNKWASLKKLQTLVDDATAVLEKTIAENEELFRDGFILVGHSQGGIVSRGVMMQHKFNVTKYISLSGVQNGFYGDCGVWFTKNMTCDIITDIMYSTKMQNCFSAAGFWRDIDRDLYLKKNLFLPILNNEEGTSATPEYQKMQKENFLQPQEYHFFGSPDDEIIRPWFTALFDTLGSDGKTRVPIEQQYIYQQDTFGLRTAIEQGRVHFYTVPGVKHEQWMQDTDIYYKYLFPLFD